MIGRNRNGGKQAGCKEDISLKCTLCWTKGYRVEGMRLYGPMDAATKLELKIRASVRASDIDSQEWKATTQEDNSAVEEDDEACFLWRGYGNACENRKNRV